MFEEQGIIPVKLKRREECYPAIVRHSMIFVH